MIAQYYMLIRLGRQGFTSIMTNLNDTSNHLAQSLVQSGRFRLLSNNVQGNGLPLVAFRLNPDAKDFGGHYDEFDVSHALRGRGWIVPAYTMAPKAESLKLMRVVVREDFSRNRCDLFIRDIMRALAMLDEQTAELVKEIREGKTHWHASSHVTQLMHGGVSKDGSMESKMNGIC